MKRFKWLLYIALLAVVVILFAPEIAHAGSAGVMIFQILGTGIGSYFGGPVGGMIGGLIGGALGNLIFGGDGNVVKGPRLSDKTVQSAAYGAHINTQDGVDRVQAQLIFSSGLKEHAHESQVGGKGMMGGASQTNITYTYSVDIMLAFGRTQENAVLLQLYADTKLIIDNTGEISLKKKWQKAGRKFVIRDGNDAQLPSALEESYFGAGNCSAHRGLFCLEAEDFQLADFANRVPNFSAVWGPGATGFGVIASYQAPAPPYSWWNASGSYLDPNGELWAMYFPFSTPYPYPGYAKIFHWTLDKPGDPIEEAHILLLDTVTQSASVHGYTRVRSDEPAAAAWGTNNNNVLASYFALLAGTTLNLKADFAPPGLDHAEFLVKDLDQIFVWFQTGHTLAKFDTLLGIYETSTTALYDDLGITNPTDFGISESYLWALTTDLIKIDRITLDILSVVPITGTTGNILAMSVESDSEIRVFTAGIDGSRFYIVDTATGVATLDKYAPSEGYAGIRGFGKWSLSYEGGLYFVQFGGYIGGFGPVNDFFGESATGNDVPLWKVVRNYNLRAGLDSVVDSSPPTVGDIVVGELTDLVHGYTVTRSMPVREALAQLQQCYFFDGREKDFKLDYPKRGRLPVRSIAGDDLAARSSLSEQLPDRLTHIIQRETEIPIRVHVIYNNWEAAYQPGHEYAPRQISESRATLTVEISVAITSTKARQIAYTLLALAQLESESFSAKSSRKHLRIDPADNIEIVITETS